VKVAHRAEETVSLGGGTGGRPDPLNADLLAVEITKKAGPALGVAPHVLGFRIDYSAERLPKPGAEPLQNHRERARLAWQ
jgi:hypothetical protein